jgi:hypothetical protein
MSHTVRRVSVAAVLSALPMAGVVMVSPAISSACVPGETAGANACAAFCLPGKALDVATGLCVPVPDPAPNGVNPPIYPTDDQPV